MTSVYAVIGDPISHSLSPVLHNAAFRATGVDAVFVPFRVTTAGLIDAVAGVRAMGLAGLSVTTPHKSGICDLLDALDPRADTLRAVNAVVVEDGRLVGHNTDGQGVVGALAAAGVEVAGRRCLVLGAGGVARAAVLALAEAGAAEVGVWARRPEAAQSASRLATQGDRLERPDPDGWDVIVNGTSVGMAAGDPSPLVGGVSAGQVLVELVYAYGETALERQARGAGADVVAGPEALLHQARAAFELWTGMAAPVGPMEMALRRAQDRGTMDR